MAAIHKTELGMILRADLREHAEAWKRSEIIAEADDGAALIDLDRVLLYAQRQFEKASTEMHTLRNFARRNNVSVYEITDRYEDLGEHCRKAQTAINLIRRVARGRSEHDA